MDSQNEYCLATLQQDLKEWKHRASDLKRELEAMCSLQGEEEQQIVTLRLEREHLELAAGLLAWVMLNVQSVPAWKEWLAQHGEFQQVLDYYLEVQQEHKLRLAKPILVHGKRSHEWINTPSPTQWRLLNPDDIVQQGDELLYMTSETKEWCAVNPAGYGSPVGDAIKWGPGVILRRPLDGLQEPSGLGWRVDLLGPDSLYYIQDDSTRYVQTPSNFATWHKAGGGSTLALGEARLFVAEQAAAWHAAKKTNVPWPQRVIDDFGEQHVNTHRLVLRLAAAVERTR